jgi:flavin reductase (DIM6/NTAB) family NADH-FMN oxidoreductase RutF
MSVSADEFRSGMRCLASSVSVVTTATAHERNGMTATAVMSLTAEPPQLGVAINRSASSFPLIRSSGCFAVNVLSTDHTAIASAFSGARGAKGEARFAFGDWTAAVTGAPVLADAPASFDCRITQEIDLGSHALFVGSVEVVRTSPANRPLLYVDASWASLVRQASAADFQHYVETMRRSLSAIEDAVARDAKPTDQLKDFVARFALVNMSKTEITRSFFREESYAAPEELAGINAMRREFHAGICELLTRGAERGEFAIEDPQITALAIIGMMVWIHRWYSDQGRLDSEEVIRQFTLLVLSMLGCRSTDALKPPASAAEHDGRIGL